MKHNEAIKMQTNDRNGTEKKAWQNKKKKQRRENRNNNATK